MYRTIGKILFLSILVVAGSVGLYVYQDRFSARHQIQKLEEEKQQLQQVVQRLGTERRVAEVLVTEQKVIEGQLYSTLLFVEYARDQTPLPAKSFTIKGKPAHIDALVIKFEQDLVAQNDPLRGHSIALFTRLYGDYQQPAEGFPIDEPGKIPDIYRGSDPRISAFEQELWQSFWRLAEDADLRRQKGVRIANGQGVWGSFDTDRLYAITVEANGGVNITSEPVKGIYLEALKRGGVR